MSTTATHEELFQILNDPVSLTGTMMLDYKWWSEHLWRIMHRQKRRYVPFIWNPIQEKVWKFKGVLNVLVKPRQVGGTTFAAGRQAHRAFTQKHYHGLITAHERGTAREILKRISGGHASMPTTIEVKGQDIPVKPRLWRENDNELVFCWDWQKERPTDFSTLSAATANGKWSVGRGFTFDGILFTEAALPEYHNGEVITAAMRALVPGGEVWMESSPMGAAGPMWRIFMKAIRGENEWVAHTPKFTDYLDNFREPISETDGLPKNEFEEELLYKYGCTIPQMLYARWTVENAMAEGKANAFDLFHQEEVIDHKRCWLVQGDAVFPVEMVQAMSEKAEKFEDPTKPEYTGIDRFRLHTTWTDNLYLVKTSLGPWRFCEEPMKGYPYGITADASSGKATGDNAVAAVWRKSIKGPPRCVGYYKGKIVTSEFANNIAAVSKKFNDAMAIPELNNDGHGLIEALVRLEVPMFRMPKREKGILTGGYETDYGFHTNWATKGRGIELLTRALMTEFHNPGSNYGVDIPWVDFWDQARIFVKTITQKMEAAGGGEDDFITNGWIAAMCLFSNMAIQEPDDIEVNDGHELENGQLIAPPSFNADDIRDLRSRRRRSS